MTFLKKVPPPPKPHVCDTPPDVWDKIKDSSIELPGVGSVWQCDKCNYIWYYVKGRQIFSWDSWQKETQFEHKRRIRKEQKAKNKYHTDA